jgi:arylsulfatase A-like enzyme
MLPNEQGFDYSFGHLVGCIDNYSHFYYWNGTNRHNLLRNNEEVFYDGQFFPDLMLKEADGFFERRLKEKPFFMFYAMNSPHYPYQGEEDWLTYYREKGVAYPRDLYAAFLSTHDERIGALIKMLEQRGLTENTIIVFQSDNGHSTEERAHHGGGFTGPFRGAKQSLFEGGIRVPAAISWPGKIKPNQVRDQFVSVVDWMPTLAELCGLNIDTSDLDGKSIVKLINNENTKTNHEMYAWEFRDTYAIRKGKWKLLGNPYDTSNRAYKYKGKHLLIDLDKDPNESVNLYDDYPQIAEELQQYYLKWKNQ